MYQWPRWQLPDDVRNASAAAAAARAQRGPSAGLPQELRDILETQLAGRLVLPGDTSYAGDCHDFNPRFDDRLPAGIAFCATESDVAACLRGVQACEVPFRLRSGGHSLAGHSTLEGGLIIDISGLASIGLQDAPRTVTVGSGCKLGALSAALDGLARNTVWLPLGGDDVGVAGYMLGGGFALTSRTLGMNSDHVLDARVMLADGRIVHASETVNPDLWWALRGGTGGNFGVLLDVTYRLQRRPEPAAKGMKWELAASDMHTASQVLATLQDQVLRGAAPELNAQADLRFHAPAPGAQPDKLVLSVAAWYFGSDNDLTAILKPLAAIPHAPQEVRLEAVTGRFSLPVLRQSRLVSDLSAAAWSRLAGEFAAHANPHASLTLEAWGGAIAAYPREKSAFVHRDASFNIYVTSAWSGPAEEAQMRAYLQRWDAPLRPFWNGGAYQNFADTDLADYRASYWGQAFPALLAVKQKYDPDGAFRFSQAVQATPCGQHKPDWPLEVVAALCRPIQD